MTAPRRSTTSDPMHAPALDAEMPVRLTIGNWDHRIAPGRPMSVHRKRIPDRDRFTGILVRLVTGCSWDVAARLTPAGETTVRKRRTEWLKAGVFEMEGQPARAGLVRVGGLGRAEAPVDGSPGEAAGGGAGAG